MRQLALRLRQYCEPAFSVGWYRLNFVCMWVYRIKSLVTNYQCMSALITVKNFFCPQISLAHPSQTQTNGLVIYDTLADSDGNYIFETVATFSCTEGFGLEGSATSTCIEEEITSFGIFSSAAPTCDCELYYILQCQPQKLWLRIHIML